MSQPRFWDPTGERLDIATFPWRLAPGDYLTRRQLRAVCELDGEPFVLIGRIGESA